MPGDLRGVPWSHFCGTFWTALAGGGSHTQKFELQHFLDRFIQSLQHPTQLVDRRIPGVLVEAPFVSHGLSAIKPPYGHVRLS